MLRLTNASVEVRSADSATKKIILAKEENILSKRLRVASAESLSKRGVW